MIRKRAFALVYFIVITFLPLWGGTGRPRDGMLSFLLLLGFLLLILGILQLYDHVKAWIEDLLEGLF